MARGDLNTIDFGPEDLRTLEEISGQLGACKSASEKAGRGAHVLTIFLKVTDEKLSAFVKEIRERMKGPRPVA